jgi:isopenicillin-N epimerase
VLLDQVRARLAAYVGAPSSDVTLIQNATMGVNIAARSLDLRAGDEVLTTSLEYGACEMAWEWLCARVGARFVRADIPLPVDDVVNRLFARKTERTRVIYVSHVTSATALRLPVEEIVMRARAEGLLTVVDGAHATGQLPLDLVELGADFYAGSCHKWLCAPRGTGFLYVRPEHQLRVDGAVVNWGYEPPAGFISRTEEQGTRDVAAPLAILAALDFQRRRDWDAVRGRCHATALAARTRLCTALGTEPIAPPEMLVQMATVRLPAHRPGLYERLSRQHKIEVNIAGNLLRISIAAYTTLDDVQRLLDVLPRALASANS